MSVGQVIEDQRFGKVSKKAAHYPQILHVNLETLFFCCLTSKKNWVETKQKTWGIWNFTNTYSSMTFCRKEIELAQIWRYDI